MQNESILSETLGNSHFPPAQPAEILLTDIDLGERARVEHRNIEGLAQAIEQAGLIQPIVLVRKSPELVSAYEQEFKLTLDEAKPYLLTAGGRRFLAIDFLGLDRVYHGQTSEPGRPGFVVRGESSLLDQLLLEARENLDREDMDWRDKLKLVVKAWRLAKREAAERGEVLVGYLFAKMLDFNVGSIRPTQAEYIYDHFTENPKLYVDCQTIAQAYSVYMRAMSSDLSRMSMAKSMRKPNTMVSSEETVAQSSLIVVSSEPLPTAQPKASGSETIETEVSSEPVHLSRAFFNTDGISLLDDQPVGFCDHIICDPDYGNSKVSLNASPNSAVAVDDYVPYETPEDSLRALFHLIRSAWRVLPDHGFFIFWYSLDYHERLAHAAKASGFAVQGWPLVWNKIDFRGRSNAQPDRNFPKSTEYAMVCRKPNALLRKVQGSCVYTTTDAGVTKTLNHPFAKPFDLWRWIYSAVSLPGQIVYDPCVGSGSSTIAAIDYGLIPSGSEIVTTIYHDLIINLQTKYTSLLGPNVRFD